MTEKVTSLKDIGKLGGVKGLAEATAEKRNDGSFADRLFDTAAPGADGEKGDLNDLLSFKPSEFVKEGKRSVAIINEELGKLELLVGKIDSAKETLQKIRDANRKKGILGRTNETRQLEAMIDAGEKAVESTDAEVLNLYRFRRDHAELRDLVDKGHAVFKALRNGEKADERTLDEIKVGYADFLHALLREERIAEVSGEQLQKWGERHESFSDHAASWLYRDCKVCERGRCRTHWFWGIHGDDQSIQLAKDLRALNNINSRIRNHLNPRPRLEAKKPAPTTTLAPTAPTNEPIEGSTPVEPAGLTSGPTES